MQSSVNSSYPRLLLVIALLAIAGIAVSSVSLWHHYSPSKTSFCDFGEDFNCDIVNKSEYSAILGVPVSLIGILGYAGVLAFATIYRSQPNSPKIIFCAALAGLFFALYLTYIEGFVLGVWCILCLSSFVVIFCITVLSSIALAQQRRNS
jgi:vitamin-K-epoxide reductase (warfarin-sensitive)